MGPAKAGGVNTLGAEENIVLGLTKRMASRILLVFVRHAALVSLLFSSKVGVPECQH